MEHWHSRRSPVLSTGGVCCSSQSLATAAGAAMLNAGGTAADACVAMAAALNVTEPCSTGIGGDAFALYYEADTKRVTCLQGNGASPAALSLELLESRGIGEGLGPWDPKSGLSVSIPGAAALWEDIQVKYGKLTLTQALAPAIHMAREGYPVGPVAANQWAGDKVRGEEASRVLFPGGKPPKAGQIFKNPDLARTFEELAEKGSKKGFYSGRIAEAIVAATKEFDGVLELEDLARHETTYYDPISVVYKGIRIYETPPPTHGLAALIALKLLEELEKSDGKGGEAEIATPAELSFTDDFRGVRSEVQNIHDSIEAMRIAYTEVLHHCADPLHCDVDSAAALLSDKYIQQRVKDIDRSKASVMFPTDDLKPFANGDTVYFSAVDKYGNACSMINSNYMGFGTGIMPKGTGFTLQNRAYNLSLKRGHSNQVAPNKKPYHTIIPALAVYEKTGELFATIGNMGGYMQPQGHMQLVRSLVDYRLDPQAAVDIPRWCVKGPGATKTAEDTKYSHVLLEDGFGEDTAGKAVGENKVAVALKERGHTVGEMVTKNTRTVYGRAQVIMKDPITGVLWAGSEPRSDGCAIPTL